MNINNKYWELLNNLDIVTIVAIAPRPGTDFIHSLFDSHPQVLTFDGWLMFHSFYENALSVYGTQNYIVGNTGIVTNIKLKKINPKDFFYEFAWKHLHKFDSRYDNLEKKDKLGSERKEYNFINIDDFVKNAIDLIGEKELSSHNALLATYGAYAITKGEELTTKKVLLHHVHLPPYVPSLANDFSKIKIIACTRDPRVYATKINTYQKKIPLSKISIGSANALFRLMIDGFEPLLNIPNVKIRVNILERLHQEPESMLRNICDWIGIDFNPVLMKSTWNGKEWFGDSLSKGINNIFDASRYKISQKRWRKDLSFIDRIVIENLMKKEINKYGYIKEYKSHLWYIVIPFLILFPTRYEINIFVTIFKRKKYSLYFNLLKIILSRYYFLYRKFFKNSINSTDHIKHF